MSPEPQSQAKVASVSHNFWIALHALRLHHWLKNCLLFVPAIITHAVSSSNLSNLCIGFVAFCCASSANYLINDLLDKVHDQQDSAKRRRPQAAGHLSSRTVSWPDSSTCRGRSGLRVLVAGELSAGACHLFACLPCVLVAAQACEADRYFDSDRTLRPSPCGRCRRYKDTAAKYAIVGRQLLLFHTGGAQARYTTFDVDGCIRALARAALWPREFTDPSGSGGRRRRGLCLSFGNLHQRRYNTRGCIGRTLVRPAPSGDMACPLLFRRRSRKAQ